MSIRLLSSLAVGETAIIDTFNKNLLIQSRLVEMGIIPGEKIRLIKIAPFKGPIEFKIRGYHISLRFKDAERVFVK